MKLLRDWHNHHYGTSYTLDDYVDDHWSKVWGTTEQETERRSQEFAALVVRNRKIKKDALSALTELGRTYDLVSVTVRRKVTVESAKEWLAEDLPGIFREVKFVPIWEEKNCPTKADVCLEVGASYLIDDSLKHWGHAAEAGIQTVLFGDYPWNRAGKLPAGITRCKDWKEVLRYFDERAS